MSDSDSDDDCSSVQYKVIVIGDGAVGKTSIVNRFCKDHFSNSYKQTIGLDFFLKRVTLPNDSEASLQVWDIGGQQIGGKMLGNYIYGSHAVLLAYDITNGSSFHNLEDWLGVVHGVFEKEEHKPYLGLIGNKMDLNHLREVSTDKHKEFATDHGMSSFFVSAKTGDLVVQCFFRVACDLSGVAISKPEMDAQLKVVNAEVVNYPQNELASTLPSKEKTKKEDGGCSVQ
eukprot:TRINITY_DN20238_c0_g1_i1.p1 TRINITY_DN20238_c0_g1~~TRINITY_DN20238_c0_g1_i1.p1  ORF type:complete len:229 (-),score=53.65 TRINITY_DN20238_c0_g1_i1:290-976(-)